MSEDPIVRLRRLLGEQWSPAWRGSGAVEKACDEIERLRHDLLCSLANHTSDLNTAAPDSAPKDGTHFLAYAITRNLEGWMVVQWYHDYFITVPGKYSVNRILRWAPLPASSGDKG